MLRYFVWVKAAKGKPWPQLWYGDQTKGDGSFQRGAVMASDDANPGDLVAFHKLEEFDSELLDVLAVRYPAPIGATANGA